MPFSTVRLATGGEHLARITIQLGPAGLEPASFDYRSNALPLSYEPIPTTEGGGVEPHAFQHHPLSKRGPPHGGVTFQVVSSDPESNRIREPFIRRTRTCPGELLIPALLTNGACENRTRLQRRDRAVCDHYTNAPSTNKKSRPTHSRIDRLSVCFYRLFSQTGRSPVDPCGSNRKRSNCLKRTLS